MGIFQQTLTHSAWKKALKKRHVTVNGVVASTATFIRGGESITLAVPEETGPQKKLIFPLTVLFEDEHLAAIHKPAGILVSGNRFKTMARALPQNLKSSSLADATVPQPVHRLDYATTGILLAGKTNRSIHALNKMFENKEVQKIYYAITIGEMDDQGSIAADVDDKPSRSEYTVVGSVPSERFGTLNLVRLQPKTGRRHQLRRHLSGIGNPILGDADYGREGLILRKQGLYLHAYSLTFVHPITHTQLYLKDELSQKFRRIFPALFESHKWPTIRK